MSNQSDESQLVRVGCEANQPDGGKAVYSRVVSLPPRCSRASNLAFQPGVVAASTRQGRGAEQAYVLWDAQTGQRVQATTSTVTYAPKSTNLFGTVPGHRIEHDEISYLKSDSLKRFLGTTQITSAIRVNLPDVWYGLVPLKYLSLSGVTPEMFRDSQVEAMLQWVRNGGCLVLLGGEDLLKLLAGPLGPAAGMRGLGTHTVDTLHVKNVSKAPAQKHNVTLAWPFPMAELYPLDATVLYEANTLPLLAVRRVGKGCIVTSAVPAGALKPQGDYNVWSDIAKAADLRSVINDGAFVEPGTKVLQQIAGRRGPDRLVPTGILAGLLVIALLLGTLLRFVRRGEWMWVLIVPLGLAVAVGLFCYSRQQVDPQRLSHIGLITGLGEDTAQVQQTFAYFSGPEMQTLSLISGGPEGLVSDLSQSAAAGMKLSEIRTTDAGTELPDQKIKPNATRAFSTYSIEPFTAVGGTLRFGETGLTGNLTNALSTDIDSAVLLVNFHTYRLGTIPAGQTQSVQIDDADLLGLVRFPLPKQVSKKIATAARRAKRKPAAKTPAKETTAPDSPSMVEGEFSSAIVPDKRQTQLLRCLITRPDFNTQYAGGVKLIGYTATAGVDPITGRDMQRQGWSILNWPIALDAPSPGETIRIPAGWVVMHYRSMNWDARNLRFIEVTRDANVNFNAAPPAGIALKNSTARIDIDVRAIDYRLDLLGVLPGKSGRKAKTVLLKTFDRPNGLVQYTIPNADRFQDAQGRVVLQLDVKRATLDLPNLSAGKRGAKKSTPGVTGAPWLLQRVDVSLKGTVR